MSQILDALRRAEAQRSRGRVPGLHETVGHVSLPPSQAQAGVAKRPLMIAAALLLVAILLGLVLLVGLPADLGPTPASRPSVADQPLHPAGANAANGQAAAPTTLENPVEGTAVRPAGILGQPVVGLPRKAQLPEGRTEPHEVSARVAVEPPPRLAAESVPTPAKADSKPGNSGKAEVPARQDLPPEIQRTLPPITVSGSVYSSDPAQRMLVINGELWHEGDQIRPGLVLEQIRRRDAVMRFNGIRFTVGPS